jgi:hypothetical protein
VGIKVEVQGYNWILRKGPRLSRDMREEMVDTIHKDFRGMEIQVASTAAGYGRIQARAAQTVHTRMYTRGAEIAGGGTRNLGGVLFRGAEFGGRRRRRSYLGRRGRKLFLIERRRVTMMFFPFIGQRGYFFYPTIRRTVRGLNDRLADAMGRGVRK